MTIMGILVLAVMAGLITEAISSVGHDVAAKARGDHATPTARKHQSRTGKSGGSQPGYARSLWDNAKSEWAEKARHRSQARHAFIAEREPVKGERWRQKKLARAEKWDAARDTLAAWHGQAWRSAATGAASGVKAGAGAVASGARQARDKARDERDQRQAYRRNQDLPAPPDVDDSDTGTTPETPETDTTSPAHTDAELASVTPIGATTMASTQVQSTGEITSLDQAIQLCRQMAAYCQQVQAVLEEPAAQANQAATDLGQVDGVVETAQGGLSGAGLGKQVTDPIASAGEQASLAAGQTGKVSEALSLASEALTTAGSAWGQAAATLEQQKGLAEQVQAQKSSGAGVAHSTEFYAGA